MVIMDEGTLHTQQARHNSRRGEGRARPRSHYSSTLRHKVVLTLDVPVKRHQPDAGKAWLDKYNLSTAALTWHSQQPRSQTRWGWP